MSKALDDLDLRASLTSAEARDRCDAAQRRLAHLTLFAAGLLDGTSPGPGIVALFEGFDAAGKGGAIRRVTEGLDPRHVRVVPVGVPTIVEAAHHFLWRFQEPLPARGGFTLFDRSWYGRLLVERVEGLIAPDVVERSAQEIVEFERMLTDNDTVVIKFWLHISADEQLRRFNDRESDPLKRWKLTPDDWHNREQRPAYIEAVNDMIAWTDRPHARWNIIAANDKHFARVAVLETLTRGIEHGLARCGATVPPSRGEEYRDRS